MSKNSCHEAGRSPLHFVYRGPGTISCFTILLKLSLLLLATILSAIASYSAVAQSGAEAARPSLKIALLTSSRTDQCFDNGYVTATTVLAQREVDRINRQGGIAGRQIQLNLVDDGSKETESIAGLRSVLGDPATLAIIGLSNSNRSAAAFNALGSDIRSSGIPFLSHIAVNSIFKDIPNVYTTQASQDEERLPVMAEFMRELGYQRIAYLGLADSAFSKGMGDGLKDRLRDRLVANYWFSGPGDSLDKSQLDAALADLRTRAPDMIVLGIFGKRAGSLVASMASAGLTPAVFSVGRLSSLPGDITGAYKNAMYQLTWDDLPETENDRLLRLIAKGRPGDWMFAGRKSQSAPGWTTGECKAPKDASALDPLHADNIRAIRTGARYADMVSLVAEALRTTKQGADIAALRATVLRQLANTYAAGRGVFKGSFDTWAFHPQARSAVRTPFVVILPQGLGRTQLAPVQFVRIKDGKLRRIHTLYIDVDLIRAHRIDDNEKMFSAEFYLSMRSAGLSSIKELEFTNAALDPKSGGRQLTIEEMHGGGASDAYPDSMQIYKVSGRFSFEPELADYPFDTQRFAINLQPKRADHPFIVQPPPLELRDKEVVTDGWDVKSQYVGQAEDFVPLLDAYTHEASVVPFNKASFVWLMKRQTTDYYLRVVVPLAFILIVAYLSYFIPTTHFEAIVTIQVTALLSAVALYLSLPKLDADSATLSDRLFVLNYLLVSIMIGISILRVNTFVAARSSTKTVLGAAHIVLLPVLLVAIAVYVLRLVEI